MLLQEENEFDNENKFVKIECGLEDLYLLDSNFFYYISLENIIFFNLNYIKKKEKGKVYYYSLENIEINVKNIKLIVSLSNIKMKDIVLNQNEGFLIALSIGILLLIMIKFISFKKMEIYISF